MQYTRQMYTEFIEKGHKQVIMKKDFIEVRKM